MHGNYSSTCYNRTYKADMGNWMIQIHVHYKLLICESLAEPLQTRFLELSKGCALLNRKWEGVPQFCSRICEALFITFCARFEN